MGGHLSKLSEIFWKFIYGTFLQVKMLPRPVSHKTRMGFDNNSMWFSRLSHALQSYIRLWGVICQNSARYSENSYMERFCKWKCCHDLFHLELGWVLTMFGYNLEDYFMVYNPRYRDGESFVKTKRDILKIHIWNVFASENVATTCFTQNSDGFWQ